MKDIDKLNVLTFSIGDEQFDFDLAADAKINKHDLHTEFTEHAECFGFWVTAYELALDQEARAKANLDKTYAQEDYQARINASQAGVKLTEKMVENTVITQEAYVIAQEAHLDAKRNVGLLRAAKDTMIHKRDTLISLGALLRAEGHSDISMKQEAVKQILKGPSLG